MHISDIHESLKLPVQTRTVIINVSLHLKKIAESQWKKLKKNLSFHIYIIEYK